jgi:hypothetical protein
MQHNHRSEISSNSQFPPTFKGRKEKNKGDGPVQIRHGNVTMKHPVQLSETHKMSFFSKTENWKANQVLHGGWHQWEKGRI